MIPEPLSTEWQKGLAGGEHYEGKIKVFFILARKGESKLNWKLMFMTFGMLFLAELGDKTQLAVFTLVTQYKNPWPIFIGGSLALTAVTLIGAFLGELVSRYVPTNWVQLGAGLLFVGIGIVVLWGAVPEFFASLK